MKKLLFLFAFLGICFDSYGQVNFKLQPNGSFLTENGESYYVIPYEGKSAHKIYNLLRSNVSGLYNNPSKVMSAVTDTSIKIRAIAGKLVHGKSTDIILGGSIFYNAYYQLMINIKDGKIKIEAPYIEDDTFSTELHSFPSLSFRKQVKKWFKKEDKYKKYH